MSSKSDIDHGRTVDWSKTSTDYARHRPGYPTSFYARLHDLGIGTAGQTVLDLGTGTGVLARAFASQGADVTGLDIAADQIAVARALAQEEHLTIRFKACAAEATDFPDHTFDI